MPAKYKLTYYNGRGRCEHIRYIFAAAEVPFEDNRITPEQWAEFKPKTPFGALPVLEADGRMIGQSQSIARYAARECGLAGKNNVDAAIADSVADTLCENREHLVAIFLEKDEDKKKQLGVKLATEQLPTNLTILEKALGNKDYFIKELSWADLMLYMLFEVCNPQMAEVLDKFPKLRALEKRVGTNRGLIKYIKQRPETSF